VRRVFEHCLHHRRQACEFAQRERFDETFLVRKVLIDRANAEARDVRDALRGDATAAVAFQYPRNGFEDGIARECRARLLRPSARGRSVVLCNFETSLMLADESASRPALVSRQCNGRHGRPFLDPRGDG
jgi:hypothetical protein